MALVISKKIRTVLFVVLGVLVLGGGGFLIWRINQPDTVAPEDSDAIDTSNCGNACTNVDDCGSALDCFNGICVNPECGSSPTCLCRDSLCGEACISSSQCAGSLSCEREGNDIVGTCVNSSCPDKPNCICTEDQPDIQCQGYCTQDSDCVSGLECIEYRCVNPECPDSPDPDCMCGGEGDVDCGGECVSTADCISGLICYPGGGSGICVNPECGDMPTCVCDDSLEGEACISSSQCDIGLECVFEDENSNIGVCRDNGGPYDLDDPIGTKTCGQSCDESNGCIEELFCFSGICVNPDCSSSPTCECRDSLCGEGCISDSQCAGSLSCVREGNDIVGQCINTSCPEDPECDCVDSWWDEPYIPPDDNDDEDNTYGFGEEEEEDDNTETTYVLRYLSDAHGGIWGDTYQEVISGENGASVKAVPYWSYEFSKWSDGSTQNPRIDTNVTSDITVTAEFTRKVVNTYEPGDDYVESDGDVVVVTETGGTQVVYSNTTGTMPQTGIFDSVVGKLSLGIFFIFFGGIASQYSKINYLYNSISEKSEFRKEIRKQKRAKRIRNRLEDKFK
jgi:hypothetical protein